MFEYENDTWTLEDLQQGAKDQGLDFDTYLEEMKKLGMVEKQPDYSSLTAEPSSDFQVYNIINSIITNTSRLNKLRFNVVCDDSKKIMDKLHTAISTYIHNIKSRVFTEWVGYTYVRFNKYDERKKMAEHCDHIHTIFDGTIKGVPILSIVGLVNDNFTGGEFYIDKKHIKLKQGDLLIFPSSFLYPHHVEPVQKGVRYTFVSWVY